MTDTSTSGSSARQRERQAEGRQKQERWEVWIDGWRPSEKPTDAMIRNGFVFRRLGPIDMGVK